VSIVPTGRERFQSVIQGLCPWLISVVASRPESAANSHLQLQPNERLPGKLPGRTAKMAAPPHKCLSSGD